MKKRILWKMFLLEIVTLGIYRIYYLIKTRREMMDANPGIKIMNPAVLIAPAVITVLAIAFLLIAIISSSGQPTTCNNSNTTYSSTQNSANNNAGGQGCPSKASTGSLIALLLFYPTIFLAVILFMVWEWSYSQGVEIITQNKLSFAMSLVVLILVPDGIDILIIQDYFNKIGAAPIPMGPQAPIAPPYPQAPAQPLPPIAPTPPPLPPENQQLPPETPPDNTPYVQD